MSISHEARGSDDTVSMIRGAAEIEAVLCVAVLLGGGGEWH